MKFTLLHDLKTMLKKLFIKEFYLLEATPYEVFRDAKIALGYKDKNRDKIQVQLRLVFYYHKENNKVYYFLTNLF